MVRQRSFVLTLLFNHFISTFYGLLRFGLELLRRINREPWLEKLQELSAGAVAIQIVNCCVKWKEAGTTKMYLKDL